MYNSVGGWSSVSTFRSGEASRALQWGDGGDGKAHRKQLKAIAEEKQARVDFVSSLPKTRVVRKYR